ncbi:hypothetical protein KAR91_30585 [Candidatus Pacearchaeota archaeon]|nr:hypothetical protein [Candidatus Pacearchaeota archaeon]
MTSCNKTEELLGENPRLAWFGLSYGFAKVEGSYGRVSWRFPVKGDDARGSFSFFMERHGGSWEMIGGNVKSGDETLGITTCRYQEKVEIPQIK